MPRETESEAFEAERQGLIADAIAETHDEIFRAAFDKEPEEGDGDTSLEEPDEVPTDTIEEGDEEGEGEEGDEEGEEEGEGDPGGPHRITAAGRSALEG